MESLNVILNFEKLRESGKRKESFPLPPPPSSPSHTIALGVDDRQACNPPNKASPEHSTCFCTSHQLWKMWLVESIQPGKFACLASKLFVRVVELNLFFFQFYPEVWTVCRIWCIYLGARAVKSMDIWWYHALGARQEFVSHLFLDKLLYGNLAAVCNGVKEEVGWGVWPTSCQTYRLFTCFGSRGRSVGVSGPPSRQTYNVFTCSGIQGGRVGDPEARPVWPVGIGTTQLNYLKIPYFEIFHSLFRL